MDFFLIAANRGCSPLWFRCYCGALACVRSVDFGHVGSVVVVHGLTCSVACPLNWQVDFLPLDHLGNPFQVFYLYFFYVIRELPNINCLVSYSLYSSGEGNGNPLQCSCLENPMDGRAWWAAVHGVEKSRIRLSDLAAAVAVSIGKTK